ncbi:MAG: hypothetical protein NVSMB67_28620 [Flavisolibacter sp.]
MKLNQHFFKNNNVVFLLNAAMGKICFSLIVLFSMNCYGHDSTKLYDPSANVQKDVNVALARARKEKKHVLLEIGGNWCVWCYKFNSFVLMDSSLKHLLENNFVVYHLNYSKENRNLAYMKKLGHPQRFGFPVIVILDAEGNRLNTQDTSLLKKGNGYDFQKVKDFFINWAPSALNDIYLNK